MHKASFILVAGLLLVLTMQVATPSDGSDDTDWSWRNMVAPDGSIRMPDLDFRKDWTVLGTWAIMGDDGDVSGMHVVYSQPSTVTAFRETGAFPDGAVLVKELLSAKADSLTTGRAAWADSVDGWFVMIKDTEKKFRGNPLWGNGWGWAYFDASDRTQTTTQSFRSECLGCHVPAKKTDWIYTQAYPVLQKP